MMYDVSVIGSGPAGLSAALNLKLHNKTVIWFGAKAMSMKVEKSEKIANYPGMPFVSGNELNKRFLTQADEMGLELTDKMVTNIQKTKKGFMLLGDNDIYEAKAVILATGSVTAKGFENETELLGRGVSYCATCDGFLYSGKTIAVYCASKRYEHEAAYLASVAEKVYLYTPYENENANLPNVEKLVQPLKAIKGNERVESIVLTDGRDIPIDGVFILRNSIAPDVLLKNLETDGPHIKVDRHCMTNISGCFAAGDCTGRPYQIAKAVGEGNVAAHSVLEYLSEAGE